MLTYSMLLNSGNIVTSTRKPRLGKFNGTDRILVTDAVLHNAEGIVVRELKEMFVTPAAVSSCWEEYVAQAPAPAPVASAQEHAAQQVEESEPLPF